MIEKRDELTDQLRGTPGLVSVGFAKQDGSIVLLVAVNEDFRGDVPKVFEGTEVIVASWSLFHKNKSIN